MLAGAFTCRTWLGGPPGRISRTSACEGLVRRSGGCCPRSLVAWGAWRGQGAADGTRRHTCGAAHVGGRRGGDCAGSLLVCAAQQLSSFTRPLVHSCGSPSGCVPCRFRECGNVVYSNVIKDEAGGCRRFAAGVGVAAFVCD